ncbi:uncharacterized protein LOC62_07G009474 [Vanrija pseudolonga]|uniref:Uncharacterized protein n=1 Tax=Vanrija pseudolonga TaxID=143232 RepID=A0AAF0YJV1_9TREE|nr:hypothetical protein LOC62_07G009474 [Vanrija pseudolonga]
MPCGNARCPPDCTAFYYGIANTYTIGLHQNGLNPQMSPNPPDDESEYQHKLTPPKLKYHLGFWFTDRAWDIADGFLSVGSKHDPPPECFDTCPTLGRYRFSYGSVVQPGFHYLEGCVDPPDSSTPSVKTSRKKGKGKVVADPSRRLRVGSCWRCAKSKALASRHEVEGATSTAPSSTDQSSTSSTSDGNVLPPPSPVVATTIPSRTTRRPQTCFCEECENPPARYARLDDSDLED